jgi:hypothetical protein
LPAPGLPGIPGGMPGTITGVPPPGAMPMVAPFALPSVPRKLRLITKDFFFILCSAPVQTGPGAHPASCKMDTVSFPRIKWLG